MQYQIENDIPVASNYRSYPISKLQPNQSVYIPCANAQEKLRARKAAYAFTMNKGWKIVTKSEPTGLRVWRLEDKNVSIF